MSCKSVALAIACLLVLTTVESHQPSSPELVLTETSADLVNPLDLLLKLLPDVMGMIKNLLLVPNCVSQNFMGEYAKIMSQQACRIGANTLQKQRAENLKIEITLNIGSTQITAKNAFQLCQYVMSLKAAAAKAQEILKDPVRAAAGDCIPDELKAQVSQIAQTVQAATAGQPGTTPGTPGQQGSPVAGTPPQGPAPPAQGQDPQATPVAGTPPQGPAPPVQGQDPQATPGQARASGEGQLPSNGAPPPHQFRQIHGTEGNSEELMKAEDERAAEQKRRMGLTTNFPQLIGNPNMQLDPYYLNLLNRPTDSIMLETAMESDPFALVFKLVDKLLERVETILVEIVKQREECAKYIDMPLGMEFDVPPFVHIKVVTFSSGCAVIRAVPKLIPESQDFSMGSAVNMAKNGVKAIKSVMPFAFLEDSGRRNIIPLAGNLHNYRFSTRHSMQASVQNQQKAALGTQMLPVPGLDALIKKLLGLPSQLLSNWPTQGVEKCALMQQGQPVVYEKATLSSIKVKAEFDMRFDLPLIKTPNCQITTNDAFELCVLLSSVQKFFDAGISNVLDAARDANNVAGTAQQEGFSNISNAALDVAAQAAGQAAGQAVAAQRQQVLDRAQVTIPPQRFRQLLPGSSLVKKAKSSATKLAKGDVSGVVSDVTKATQKAGQAAIGATQQLGDQTLGMVKKAASGLVDAGEFGAMIIQKFFEPPIRIVVSILDKLVESKPMCDGMIENIKTLSAGLVDPNFEIPLKVALPPQPARPWVTLSGNDANTYCVLTTATQKGLDALYNKAKHGSPSASPPAGPPPPPPPTGQVA